MNFRKERFYLPTLAFDLLLHFLEHGHRKKIRTRAWTTMLAKLLCLEQDLSLDRHSGE